MEEDEGEEKDDGAVVVEVMEVWVDTMPPEADHMCELRRGSCFLLFLPLSLPPPPPLPPPPLLLLPWLPGIGGPTAASTADTADSAAAEKEDDAEPGLERPDRVLFSEVTEDDRPDRRVPPPLLGRRPNQSCSGGTPRVGPCPLGVDSTSRVSKLRSPPPPPPPPRRKAPPP